MKIFFSIVLLIITINFYGQNDASAVKLLDKVSLKIDKADTFKIEFSYHLDENIDQKEKGVVIIKKDNYVLDFFGVKQISDSKFAYILLIEQENYEIEFSINWKYIFCHLFQSLNQISVFHLQ